MRTVTVICAILMLSAFGFGQTSFRAIPGYCPYGCGPYVPLLTTPQLWLGTVSPNPVGATNATGGLVAGATNGTLSEVPGNLSAVYTMPVWLAGGGTPLISPAVNAPIYESAAERMGFGERMHRRGEGEQAGWLYFSSAEQTASPVLAAHAARGRGRAARTYSNEDVRRQNQQNGAVKYDGRTLKIQ